MEENNQLKIKEKNIEKLARTLHLFLPKGNLPAALKLISLFTLVGGLSIMGSLFVDIVSPPDSIGAFAYLVRLLVGVMALGTAYAIIKKDRLAIWLYGAITLIGLFFNPVAGAIPLMVSIYLFRVRAELKPSFLDTALDIFWRNIKEAVEEIKNRRQKDA